MSKTKKEPTILSEPSPELDVEGAIGRAPTQDELRNLVWRFVTMEDVRKVIVTIIQDAQDGKPTAMGLAVHLLGLDVEGDSRQKSPAEGILEKIRDIIALQKFPSLQLNLNVSSEELYGNIIRGSGVTSSTPQPWPALGSSDYIEGSSVPSPELSTNLTTDENTL